MASAAECRDGRFLNIRLKSGSRYFIASRSAEWNSPGPLPCRLAAVAESSSAKVVKSDGTTGPDVPFYHVVREDEGK
jgi:hypothetical protein